MAGKFSSRKKNALTLRVRALMNELEADIDENKVRRDVIRGRFSEVEEAYFAFQSICTDAGKHFQTWQMVDQLAQLRVDCAVMEKDFKTLWHSVSNIIAKKEHADPDMDVQKDTEVKQFLFEQTASWDSNMELTGQYKPKETEEEEMQRLADEYEVKELQKQIQALTLQQECIKLRRDEDGRSSISGQHAIGSESSSSHGLQGETQGERQYSCDNRLADEAEDDVRSSVSQRAYAPAARTPLTSTRQPVTSTPGLPPWLLSGNDEMTPIDRHRASGQGSVMRSIVNSSISDSSYCSFKGLKRDRESISFMRSDRSLLSQDLSSGHKVAAERHQITRQVAQQWGSYTNQKQSGAVDGRGVTGGAKAVVDQQKSGHGCCHVSSAERPAPRMESYLGRVKIPTFKGDAEDFEPFWAAFVENVDRDESVPVCAKLLHLHGALGGDALKAVKRLGYGAEAYMLAMETLEERYGGSDRYITHRVTEMQKFKPIRDGNVRDMEAFMELVDSIILAMRRDGAEDQLGKGILYTELQQKMGQRLVARYRRWGREHGVTADVYSLREFIKMELYDQMAAAEIVHGAVKTHTRKEPSARGLSAQAGNQQGYKSDKGTARPAGTATRDGDTSAFKCKHCGEHHGLWKCLGFQKLSTEERWRKAREYYVCFRCLSSAHRGVDCTWARRCGVNGCSANHHQLLHDEKKKKADGAIPAAVPAHREVAHAAKPDSGAAAASKAERSVARTKVKAERRPPSESESDPANMMGLHQDEDDSRGVPKDRGFDCISLRTVAVKLHTPTGVATVMAMIDDGATLSYISRDLATHMGLRGEEVQMGVHTLGGGHKRWIGEKVKAKISSWEGTELLDIKMRTVPDVMVRLNPVNWRRSKHNWEHLKGLPFPPVLKGKAIELLIGVDNFYLHDEADRRVGGIGEPYARLTPLGWTAVGPSSREGTVGMSTVPIAMCSSAGDCLERQVARYWDMEEPPEGTMRTPSEMAAEQQVEASCVEHDGYIELGLPWKVQEPDLPNSMPMALQRLLHTERKLLRDDKMAQGYQAILLEYLRKGYIRKVAASEPQPRYIWYIPHFPVVRLDKETTKCRIVFDGSATVRGVSLNSFLLTGPNLQCNLIDVLYRFRRWPIALVCDIAEMYLQIRVRGEDRGVLRFLWRDLDRSKDPDVYESNRVMFGLMPSPYQAHFVRKRTAKKYQEALPAAAETVDKSTYMDDGLDSTKSIAAAIELYKQLLAIWKKIGMWPRKWASNSLEVLRSIPQAERMQKIQLESGELGKVKTLGVSWNAQQDVFTFDVELKDMSCGYTKRSFLSAVATVYDPMGLASPVIIVGRIILQKMWMEGLEWDQEPSPDLLLTTKEWYETLPALQAIQVPRPLATEPEWKSFEVHVFSDASGEAYGAVAYSRMEYNSGRVVITLISSKVKVAPMNAVSIPRLELMGAALGVKLVSTIKRVLDVGKADVHHWSDSTDVLYWVHGCSRQYRPFIANRVGLIQAETDLRCWHYVPTKENPADPLSRGVKASDIGGLTVWWEGPAYLKEQCAAWPKIPVKIPDGSREERKMHTVFAGSTGSGRGRTVSLHESGLDPARYSSWTRALSVAGWVLRFTQKCASSVKLVGEAHLTPAELDDAAMLFICYAQQDQFEEELRCLRRDGSVRAASRMCSLQPWLDHDGVIRMNGRLKESETVNWDTKNAIILPRSHPVTRLIINHYHVMLHHSGMNHILSETSKKYWIIAGREAIKECIRQCMVCRRRSARPAQQVMAPLPAIRTQKTLQAFQNVSVDFAGPFITKQGRGKTRLKRYLCLFDCMNTRGVHLEVAMSMDVHDFMNVLSRMIARRGKPHTVWSDNGTNFVAANKELQEAVGHLDVASVQSKAAHLGITWRFNPPAAPHHNGVHEILVKAAKRAMYAIIGNAELTDDELNTIVTTVEGLMNSRPLGYQSSDPRDDTPLTPNHFLMGRVGENMAPDPEDDRGALSLRKRWRRVQEVVRHFWERWQKEILPALQPRSKWRVPHRDVKAGDVVLVVDPDLPRGKWGLGRIHAVFPGTDNHVRAVDVCCKGSVYRRPIQKICPLEMDV